ncbi:unnamed protein product [Cylindrotheca closterium]|uniref:Peptidase S9 prolyl oligopeptidase catalytic domain-containing protein n=1 Tax=Cylindrotheca closterium TaxID=2856 RepID=A0AAD2FXX1_9STRA|nr:unnamed protein product [Cylindrotheca closterium]
MTSSSSTTIKDKPFGAWESPITSQSITAGSVRLGGLTFHDQTLYWLEGRPQEGGRQVLCSDKGDVLPKDSNARTRVHEYGGAAVTMAKDKVYFSEFATQQLCCLESDKKVEPMTPDGNRYRFADGVYDETTNQIFCVREDHLVDGKATPQQVVNEIVSIQLDGSMEMKVLATGNDFYAAPRLSPDGTKLAYITWNHPNMPWDATELRLMDLNRNGDSTLSHLLLAGSDKNTSIMQPKWHPQTGDLYYISDQSGFYNIYRTTSVETNTVMDEKKDPILPMEVDFGGAAPGWGLGQQGFTFLADGRLIAQYTRDGESVLLVAEVPEDGIVTNLVKFRTEDGLPMQFGGVVVDGTADPSSPEALDVYFLGGSPSTPSSIYKWNLETKGPAEILKKSSTLSFDESVISVPQQVEFPTTLGKAYGYYYPPKNGDYQCTTEKAPPLLVKAHGGPTACTGTSFNAGIQFWTSRGFAVLDVDYGGSTGYGRDYRRRLRGSWGIVDIDDVCNGATHLVKEGLADGDRLCIDGGSAGGYTTLGALAFKDVFKAGCSLYGVGDLTALAGDTHKFESRYLDGLVGPYPEDEAIYKERSPIESADKLSCPVLLLQGSEDKIVPPNQAEMMHKALLEKGIPTCLKIYEGEQHGFRKAENIEDALDSELAFYGKVFGIDVPGAVDIKIDNMK